MDNPAALKRQAAAVAVELVESGMVVGLGAGSTALHAIMLLGQKLAQGELRAIRGIPCSQQVAADARVHGVPLTDLDEEPVIDLTIDGADEVDPDLNLIKGGGGALLWEKIVAQASRREVIIVDHSKISPALGTTWALPVEVIPFGWRSQERFLQDLGAVTITRRQTPGGEIFHTDQGNFILDAHFGPMADAPGLARQIKARTGIVEHGLFINLATDLIIAHPEGVEHRRSDR
jgi:ribose 5-phosphate isomerase A